MTPWVRMAARPSPAVTRCWMATATSARSMNDPPARIALTQEISRPRSPNEGLLDENQAAINRRFCAEIFDASPAGAHRACPAPAALLLSTAGTGNAGAWHQHSAHNLAEAGGAPDRR